MEYQERYRGCLLGLAAGDALGTTLEFRTPGSFEPLEDVQGGGPFGLEPGQWTDDTSMALCLAESLVTCQGFDAADQMRRYVCWMNEGYLSSTGACFDIGNTVRRALLEFQETEQPFCGPTDRHSAGNGSLMRLAPIPMLYQRTPAAVIRQAAQSSRVTHGARVAVDCCRYLAGIIAGALNGEGREALLGPLYSPLPHAWEEYPLAPEVEEVARGSFKRLQPPEIEGSGYAVKSLEAALWAFHKAEDFRHGSLLAVNLGDDADTTGAIYGQMAGAYFGEGDIPETWRSLVLRWPAGREGVILEIADKLLELAER